MTQFDPAAAARLQQEIEDSFDEELEAELSESLLEMLGDEAEMEEAAARHANQLDRRVYFRELFRLQHELIRLQDWVVDQKLKVVVLFEGRDAAGRAA